MSRRLRKILKSTDRLPPVKPSGEKENSFYEQVYEIVRRIPKGRITTYGAIAAALGTRLSARVVGWSLLPAHHFKTPVPTHRVVNRNGLLSARHHYQPPARMQELLEKEGIKVTENQVIDFDRVFWDPGEELGPAIS